MDKSLRKGSWDGFVVEKIHSSVATELVILNHYLHRRPPISYAYGLVGDGDVLGVCTFGTPPSRQAQKSVCPTDPSLAIELNRLWVSDNMPKNTASWFVSRSLKLLPPKIVFSYADTSVGHDGTVYRAMSWNYAGWTDMERKTARYDYIPISGGHSRDAYRTGIKERVRRKPKAKYWTTTGSQSIKRKLSSLCGWEILSWDQYPTPNEHHKIERTN